MPMAMEKHELKLPDLSGYRPELVGRGPYRSKGENSVPSRHLMLSCAITSLRVTNATDPISEGGGHRLARRSSGRSRRVSKLPGVTKWMQGTNRGA
jgi:hypothetical protein